MLIQPSGSLSASLRTGIASFAAGPISPSAVSEVLRTFGHLSSFAAFARAGTAVVAHFGPISPRDSAAATRISGSRSDCRTPTSWGAAETAAPFIRPRPLTAAFRVRSLPESRSAATTGTASFTGGSFSVTADTRSLPSRLPGSFRASRIWGTMIRSRRPTILLRIARASSCVPESVRESFAQSHAASKSSVGGTLSRRLLRPMTRDSQSRLARSRRFS